MVTLISMRPPIKGKWLLLAALLLFVAPASAKVVETRLVHLPANGRVIVRSREVAGKFLEMVFISQRSGKVLRKVSARKYDGAESYRSLRVVGVRATDQRQLIPMIKDYLK
ncbi:MAG: hypothetical protein ABI999_18010 [Acidobacteriota bacterium]